MASRSFDDLHPKLKPLAEEFVRRCESEGIKVLVYVTYRSNAEQDDLFAQGRTKPGKRVTNAKGGQSSHNFTLGGKPASLAFDACPTRKGPDGRTECVWNDPELWEKMGEAAEEVGLHWGGGWMEFADNPHFYISLKEADNVK